MVRRLSHFFDGGGGFNVVRGHEGGNFWNFSLVELIGIHEIDGAAGNDTITGSSYVDPITDDLTFGNPGVEPAEVTNYDLCAEWFFGCR
mgnify:CR=1 FL=1